MSRLKKFLVVSGIIVGAIIFLIALILVMASLANKNEEGSAQRNYPRTGATSYTGSAGLGAPSEMATKRIMADYDTATAPAPASASKANVGGSSQTSLPEASAKVIKTGQLELEVKQVSETINKITAYVKQKGGFVADSSVETVDNGIKYATVVARVPAKNFETAMTDFKLMAQSVKEESVAGQDITEEYVDLQSRLKNLRLEEQQYQTILKTAKTTTDILQVNKYLYSVRDEIERIEGRMRYMDNLTDLSTITLNLSEEATVKIPTGEWHPFTIIKEALRATVIFWQGLATVLIWTIFLLVPLLLVIWLIYRGVKALRARRQMKQ